MLLILAVINRLLSFHLLSCSVIIDSFVPAGVSSHMDDEYKWAGVEDPKVMVTTSRDPSSRLKMFAKVRFASML